MNRPSGATPSEQTAAKTTPVYLSQEADGKRFVIIEERDRRKHYKTVDQMVKACRSYDDAAEFAVQMDDLLEHLAKWLKRFSDRLESAYLTPRDSGLLFLVITASAAYQEDLQAAITALDLEIANDGAFSRIRLDTLLLPKSDRDSILGFLSEWSIEFRQHAQ